MTKEQAVRTDWRVRTRKLIRRSWMKYAMKGVAGADAYDRLDRVYALEDPWNLNSELEVARFEWTNRIIERAPRRVPAAQFAVAELSRQPWGEDRGRFELITACELLYYVSDIGATLDRMSHLGKQCLATVFGPAAPRVWSALRERIADRRDWYCLGHTVWVAGWWSNV